MLRPDSRSSYKDQHRRKKRISAENYRKGVNKMGVYEELQARGLIAQVTNEEEIRKW